MSQAHRGFVGVGVVAGILLGSSEPAWAACQTSTGTWQNMTLAAQTGVFTVAFEATPSLARLDGVIGLSSAPATAYSKLGPIVRFNSRGRIDARNGSVYAAPARISYSAGRVYRFRLLIHLPTHTYSAYVREGSGGEQLLASDFAFRSEQQTVSSLNSLGFYDSIGSTTVCQPTVSVVETTAPTVAITAPGDGTTVFGSVSVSADASDDVGVSRVEFLVDGVVLATDTTSAYGFNWDTAAVSNGSYTLTAQAFDAVGNFRTTSVQVTVNNAPLDTTPPILSALTVAGITQTGARIVWTSDEPSDSQVEYGLTTTYGTTTPLSATLATNHSLTLSALTAGTRYYYRALSRDSSGNLAVSNGAFFTTEPPPDTTTPVASITSPGAGEILSGLTSLSATATDNVGVARVEFYRDNNLFLGSALFPPYTVSLDTTALPDGPHTFFARAYDAADNAGTSAAVALTVDNTGSSILLSDSFDQPHGLITNEYAYWSPKDPLAFRSVIWEMTSGSFFADSQTGWSGVPDARVPTIDSCSGLCTNSAIFRLTSKAAFDNVSVSFSLLNEGLSSTSLTPAVAWDGVHIFLRHVDQYRLYYASINRRDNKIVIKKKVTNPSHTGPSNGGWYCDLSFWGSYPVPYGSWQQVEATIRTEDSGSVAITLSADGKLLLSATDAGSPCSSVTDPILTQPITVPGQIGIRGDNANFRIDNVAVRAIQ